MLVDGPISSDVFKQSMRLLAGGVCIVATKHNGQRFGLTMTAVCSLTVEPPSLIACVNRDAGTRGLIGTTKRVSVNVLSLDQVDVAELFASSNVRGSNRFDQKKWVDMASGVPGLIAALAVFDCEVIEETSIGQHSVFFFELKGVRLRSDKNPLVYFNRQFCSLQPIQ